MKGRGEQDGICWKNFSAPTAAPLPQPPTNSQKLKLSNIALAQIKIKIQLKSFLIRKSNVVNNDLSGKGKSLIRSYEYELECAKKLCASIITPS